jgi:hypothetical protein
MITLDALFALAFARDLTLRRVLNRAQAKRLNCNEKILSHHCAEMGLTGFKKKVWRIGARYYVILINDELLRNADIRAGHSRIVRLPLVRPMPVGREIKNV